MQYSGNKVKKTNVNLLLNKILASKYHAKVQKDWLWKTELIIITNRLIESYIRLGVGNQYSIRQDLNTLQKKCEEKSGKINLDKYKNLLIKSIYIR